jgi:hypothetical protein
VATTGSADVVDIATDVLMDIMDDLTQAIDDRIDAALTLLGFPCRGQENAYHFLRVNIREGSTPHRIKAAQALLGYEATRMLRFLDRPPVGTIVGDYRQDQYPR